MRVNTYRNPRVYPFSPRLNSLSSHLPGPREHRAACSTTTLRYVSRTARHTTHMHRETPSRRFGDRALSESRTEVEDVPCGSSAGSPLRPFARSRGMRSLGDPEMRVHQTAPCRRRHSCDREEDLGAFNFPRHSFFFWETLFRQRSLTIDSLASFPQRGASYRGVSAGSRRLAVCVRYVAACGVLSMRNVACHPRPVVTWSPARSALGSSSSHLSSVLPSLAHSYPLRLVSSLIISLCSAPLSLFSRPLTSAFLPSVFIILFLFSSFFPTAYRCMNYAHTEEIIPSKDEELHFLLCLLSVVYHLSFLFLYILLFISTFAPNDTVQ